MNNILTNEKGAALVIVLLTIVLLGIFGTSLTGQLLSTGEQAEKSEAHVKAEQLAIMGETLLYKEVKKQSRAGEELSLRVEYDRSFGTDAQYHVTVHDVLIDELGNGTVHYESVGVVDGTEETITGSFTIQNNQSDWIKDILDQKRQAEEERSRGEYVVCGNAQCDIPEDRNAYYPNGIYVNRGPVKSISIGGDLWVSGDVAVSGSRSITIQDFVVLENTEIDMNGATQISILGDAYFDFRDVDFSGSIRGDIYVQGNAYFVQPEGLTNQHAFCIKGKTNLEGYNSEQACQ